MRKQDGTIIDLQFTNDRPGAAGSKPKPVVPGSKSTDKPPFKGVYGKIIVAIDGVEQPYDRSLLVGSQDDFGITEDGRGLTGTTPISEDLPWGLFYRTLCNPLNGGEGFDESVIDESDPEVADYTPVIGARCQFDWQVNAKATQKYGKVVSKKDPKKSYDREELIVAVYYGQAEEAAPAAPAKKAAGRPAVVAKGGRKAAAPTVDIAELAATTIIDVLTAAPNATMTKVRLGAKLLVALQSVDDAIRAAVRTWATDNDNLSAIEGVDYDAATQTLTLA